MKWSHFMDLQLERMSRLRSDGSILRRHLKDVLLAQLRWPDQRWRRTHEYVIAGKRSQCISICKCICIQDNCLFSTKLQKLNYLAKF